ncbi:MAG TPA: DUF6198 family protein [Pseudoflavonifractor sp.]|nr:DUF6198 family protein [Pseudoflavonifractor sp.]
MEKKKFYTELAYVLGLAALALGTAFMEGADFGVSMVVAPAYLVYLKLSQVLPFFTFGMAEYILQAVLLVVLMVVLRRFRFSYLFSFVTAILYGLVLDGAMAAVARIPHENLVPRLALYGSGLLLCAAGVSLLFHTYIAPEVYELFVKEVSARYGVDVHAFKTGYDCVSCLAAICLSFAFFGLWHFEGVKLGTVFCALINGWVIGRCSHFLENHWEFQDGLKLPIRC